jgi:hypothetical protein
LRGGSEADGVFLKVIKDLNQSYSPIKKYRKDYSHNWN